MSGLIKEEWKIWKKRSPVRLVVNGPGFTINLSTIYSQWELLCLHRTFRIVRQGVWRSCWLYCWQLSHHLQNSDARRILPSVRKKTSTLCVRNHWNNLVCLCKWFRLFEVPTTKSTRLPTVNTIRLPICRWYCIGSSSLLPGSWKNFYRGRRCEPFHWSRWWRLLTPRWQVVRFQHEWLPPWCVPRPYRRRKNRRFRYNLNSATLL